MILEIKLFFSTLRKITVGGFVKTLIKNSGLSRKYIQDKIILKAFISLCTCKFIVLLFSFSLQLKKYHLDPKKQLTLEMTPKNSSVKLRVHETQKSILHKLGSFYLNCWMRGIWRCTVWYLHVSGFAQTSKSS